MHLSAHEGIIYCARINELYQQPRSSKYRWKSAQRNIADFLKKKYYNICLTQSLTDSSYNTVQCI